MCSLLLKTGIIILATFYFLSAKALNLIKSKTLWFGKELTLPKEALVFTCLQYKSFENTAGKGEIAHNEQFLLFPLCFLPVLITSCHFDQTQNCCLQSLSVWKSPKSVVW